ncbi:hypothetical protein BDV96DRAFT_693002 [Lophiotrema nucula]|uniref:Zn(2)-C6 fungal-type domain-containing protein n=1 Tax=Lophiotrema nucula TaxID=690887 RepID=A0A6A5YLS6_9PLEO|nr:hypothetical protein BDV96DRAFT_693002 [Lophiotrema nucula]
MCPFTSLPSGEGPARFSPSSVRDWQPRRKSVSNACERCRRRKIRCDGDTPCATCKRFSLPCIRTQKPREAIASEHQAALESRIHQLEAQVAAHVSSPTHGSDGARIQQLEAQLAAHVSTPIHGMEGMDQSLMGTPTSIDWQSPPPHLSLDTSFPGGFGSQTDLDLGSFSASSIPSIAITECEPSPHDSPCSPVPSFWSGATRASSPEMPPTSAPQFVPNLAVAASTKPYSTSPAPHTATTWEFMDQDHTTHLKHSSTQSADLSRRSSVSSSSLDSDPANSPFPDLESDVDMLPLGPAPRLPRQGIFAPATESPPPGQPRPSFTDQSRALSSSPPWPSRFEAETLTTDFVQHLESFEHKPYAISPVLFAQLCEFVYPDPKGNNAPAIAISTRMARFHVFLAMAIGMKVRIRNSPEPTNALLDRCYELAMQQASTSTFWQEKGGVEAAQLLTVFALLKKDPVFDPKPLQPSFTW